MRKPAGFKGVLMDLWGTLVPAGSTTSSALHLLSMARTLGIDPKAFARDWAESLEERCIGALGPLEETIRRIALRQGVKPSEESVARALEIRLVNTRFALEAGGLLLPALDALRGAGMRLAVVSDATEETPRLWSSIPLGSRFQATVFSCVTGFCKPDPRTYRLALRELGLQPDECVFVGDGGSRELTGAKAIGIEAFLFRFPGQPEKPEYRYLPDNGWDGPTLHDLGELLAIEAPREGPTSTRAAKGR
ncbi:MAG: HAD family hydrolase [Thermoplasmata archaeon]|nr:HAD family hydrolase [Thermoplasmata archaeon]